jgi:uncharacterized protein (DUF1015 family)
MSEARAFPIIRYDPDVVGDPGALLAPPYDVVSKAQRDELAGANAHQSIILEVPDDGLATTSGRLLRAWLDEGALTAGEVGLAVVRQRFVGPDGVRRERTSVCCEVRLEPFGSGYVLPHERTFDGPRKARTELMRGTGANVSPVFLAYHDPERSLVDLFASVTDDEPDFTGVDPDGTQSAVWFVTDVSLTDAFTAAVDPHALLIADGHHRYTAALEYQAEVSAGRPHLVEAGGTEYDGPPYTASSWENGVLAMVANSADPGIVVFPTHRILRGADPARLDRFIVEAGAFADQVFATVDEAMAALELLDVPGFVVLGGGRPIRLLSVPDELDMQLAAPDSCDAARRLDVLALHALLLDGGAVLTDHLTADGSLTYTRVLAEAVQAAEDGGSDTLVFVMREIDPMQIHEVARHGELLPQKSTYYYPKVPTGVAFRAVDPTLLGLHIDA